MKSNMKRNIVLGLFACFSATAANYAGAASITVKHALGTTTLNGVPERVVVLGAGPLDALDAFGIDPVGVTKFPAIPDYLKKYNTDAYPSAGTLFEPDFEQIYSEKPDLILMGPRNTKNYEELSKIAPTVLYTIDTSEGIWESTKDEWRMLGKIFNIEAKVDAKIQTLDQDFKAIKSYNQAHPVTAMTVMSMGGNLSTFGADSRFGSIYKDFGFTEIYHTDKASPQFHHSEQANGKTVKKAPIAKKGEQGPKGRHGNLVSFEFIQEKNPDVLFVLDKDELVNHGQSSVKDSFNNALIQSTNAYKNSKIDYLDINAWYVSIAGVHSTEQMIKDIKKVVKVD